MPELEDAYTAAEIRAAFEHATHADDRIEVDDVLSALRYLRGEW